MPGSSLFDRLLCCCVTNGSGQVGSDDYLFNAGGSSLVGAVSVAHEQVADFSLSSAAPRFPSGGPSGGGGAPQDAPAGGGGAPPSAAYAAGGSGPGDEAGYGYGYGIGFNGQAAVVVSAEEKEREKARLQKLVKEFAKEAVTGIVVSLISPQKGILSPHFFQMDRHLTVFSLQPKDGSSSASGCTLQYVNVRDLTQIYKGAEVSLRAPALGEYAALCVGVDTRRADRQLFFCFDEPLERDKFYTCLKILRMSVDIHRGEHASI